MSAPRLTGEQKDSIVASYLAGEKLEAIAALFSVDRSYPRLLAKRRGCLARPARVHVEPKWRAAARDLNAEGLCGAKIAVLLNVDPSSVSRALREVAA